ncbi:MAG: tetratricopeptide repeat protein [Chromatiales bacterium]|jgi:tetratricopeptide (TPR) repeat protein|nr:tetratricopeptide repeat protein [Chromatiales bacterium]
MRAIIPLAAILSVSGFLAAPVSVAQEQTCEGPEGVERKERPSLIGERTFRRLSAVHEQLGENNYSDALKGLNALNNGNLNDYESAMVNQTFGYVYAAQGKYDQAIPYFENALKTDALPNSAHFGLMYSLAQLYAGQEKHQQTVDLMLQYLSFQCDPPPQAYIALGSSYASLGQFNNALPYVQKAIVKAGDDAQESWYLLELAIYFEQKDYPAAGRALTQIVAKWPEKLKYWEMLSGAYQEQQKDLEALGILMLAYRKGLIYEAPGDQVGKKLLNLVRMNMFVEVPFMAGSMLESEIAAGRIEANEKNLTLLLSAWTQAREFDRAIATIDRLAPMKPDGELYLQKAQLLAEKSDWSGTVEAARQAIEKGGLKKPGGAYLLIGIASNELRDWQQAMDALKEARQYDKNTRRQATDWMKFVEDRMAVARN